MTPQGVVVIDALGSPALARELMAIEGGYDRCRVAGDVDEDRGRRAAGLRTVVDACEHDERVYLRQTVRHGQQHGDRSNRSNARQDADQRADKASDEADQQRDQQVTPAGHRHRAAAC